MAKAEKVPAKTEVVEVEPEKVVLTLTLDEANYMFTLVGRDSGDIAWSLYESLRDVGTLADRTLLGKSMMKRLGY